jgi:hypothetical protein
MNKIDSFINDLGSLCGKYRGQLAGPEFANVMFLMAVACNSEPDFYTAPPAPESGPPAPLNEREGE